MGEVKVQHSVSFDTVKWKNFHVRNLNLPMLLSSDHNKQWGKRRTPVHHYIGSVDKERSAALRHIK
jgi:hypothetical protein